MNPAVCAWCGAALRRKDLAAERTLVTCHACRRMTARVGGRAVAFPSRLGVVQHSARRVRWTAHGVRGGLAGGGPRGRGRTAWITVGGGLAIAAVGFALVGPLVRGGGGRLPMGLTASVAVAALPFALLWTLASVRRRVRDVVFGRDGAVARGRGLTPVPVADVVLEPAGGVGDAVAAPSSIVVLDARGERTPLASFGPLLRPHAELLVGVLRRAAGLASPSAPPTTLETPFGAQVAAVVGVQPRL